MAAAVSFTPPNRASASAFAIPSTFVSMTEVNHTFSLAATFVDEQAPAGLTLPAMLEQDPVRDRLKLACKEAGYGGDGDTAASRGAIAKVLGISKTAVAKLFNGDTNNFKPAHLFIVADLLKVDARWLATGAGEMHPTVLPTDVMDVARLLHRIADTTMRRGAVNLARSVAVDPMAQMAKLAEGQRWSSNVQRIADGLETMDDGELKKAAMAWATTAAFNPERLPRDTPPAEAPARRATDKRSAKS